MDMFLFLCVCHCGFCSLLVFRNLLLLIHISVYFRMFLSFFYLFLCFPNSLHFSPRFFLKLKIFLSFVSPPHCIIMTQYVFQSLLRLLYRAKSRRSLWMIIFVRVGSKSQFKIVFFQIILCCRLIQTQNTRIQNFTLQTQSVLNNLLK